MNNQNLVGEEEFTNGFGFGNAPKSSVPQDKKYKENQEKENKEKPEKKHEEVGQKDEKNKNSIMNIEGSQSDMETVINGSKLDKEKIFNHYKENQGLEQVNEIRSLIQSIKEVKRYFDEEKWNCEKFKQQINQIQISLKNRKGEEINMEELNEEEMKIVNELKDLKKKYKMEYENYVFHKKSIRENEKKVTDLKLKLMEDFSAFLKEQYNVSFSKIDRTILEEKKSSQKEIMNTQEEIYDAAFKKFKTTMKAKRLDKIMGNN